MKIHIVPEVSNHLEALCYEVESRQNVIAFMIDHNLNLHTEVGEQYQKELRDFTAKYAMAQRILSRDLMKLPGLKNKDFRWDLDFDDCEVTIRDAKEA